ncbi:50S ribosomal protein L9 [Candidatus Uhrbacteria bacterium]|nr:50S ribosomal protein L9 [Candidatus Uhrbacteria bacterium]
MRVLLLKDIESVGTEGEVHDVADGYAQNFLFPRHLAVPATPAAAREIVERRAAQRRAAEHELHELQRLAGALDGHEFTMSSPASANGKLYGSVGTSAIAELLTARGFPVSEAWVQLASPLRELGEHHVRLQLPHGLEAEVVLIVEGDH